MKNMPCFLIVSGNGRDAGKTSFVCSIIKAQNRHRPITAIKVTPHLHQSDQNGMLLAACEGYHVFEELDAKGHKDSSRMLAAGAGKVFYIEARDDALSAAMEHLFPLIPAGSAVICESGGMRDVLIPSMFLLVNRLDGRDNKPGFVQRIALADRVVLFDGTGFDPDPEQIRFRNASWEFVRM